MPAQLVSDPVVAGLSDLIGRKKIMIIRPVSSLLCRLLQLYGMLNPAVFLFTELVANTIEGSSTPGGLLVRQRFASPAPPNLPACPCRGGAGTHWQPVVWTQLDLLKLYTSVIAHCPPTLTPTLTYVCVRCVRAGQHLSLRLGGLSRRYVLARPG